MKVSLSDNTANRLRLREADQRQDLHALRHPGVPGARDHTVQGTDFSSIGLLLTRRDTQVTWKNTCL